ncbi:MAG TPA: transcriptional regulator [Acidimicrobiales bacterium]|nr:transcriptional regulator [Acidimicrobiales bacterium]
MTEEWDDPGYARLVGERLRDVRKQKGLSLQAVEARSDKEFKASVLGAYERGERSISVPRLQRLAAIYNVPVDQLLPKPTPVPAWGAGLIDLTMDEPAARAQAAAGAGAGGSPEGKVAIDLSRLEVIEGPERELLRRYLASIQVQRQDFNGRVLTIRAEDIQAVARLFDLSALAMRERLNDLGLCLQR